VAPVAASIKPHEKFAQMIETHWNGIVAFCGLENKVSLGFLEGLNSKIRVMQHRAYGFCFSESLKRTEKGEPRNV